MKHLIQQITLFLSTLVIAPSMMAFDSNGKDPQSQKEFHQIHKILTPSRVFSGNDNPMRLSISYGELGHISGHTPIIILGKSFKLLSTGASPYNNNPKPNFTFQINNLPGYLTLNNYFYTEEGWGCCSIVNIIKVV